MTWGKLMFLRHNFLPCKMGTRMVLLCWIVVRIKWVKTCVSSTQKSAQDIVRAQQSLANITTNNYFSKCEVSRLTGFLELPKFWFRDLLLHFFRTVTVSNISRSCLMTQQGTCLSFGNHAPMAKLEMLRRQSAWGWKYWIALKEFLAKIKPFINN